MARLLGIPSQALPPLLWHSPSVAVRGVDVGSNVDKEIHNVIVGATDGVVESSDPLIVGLAGVIQLPGRDRGQHTKTQFHTIISTTKPVCTTAALNN